MDQGEKRSFLLLQLNKFLVKFFFDKFNKLYVDVKSKNKNKVLLLKEFQYALREMAAWDQTKRQDTYAELKDTSSQYDVLLREIYKLFVSDKTALNKDIGLDYTHNCYLNIGRKIWKEPYLFYDIGVTKIEMQKNFVRLEKLIKLAIYETFIQMVPVELEEDIPLQMPHSLKAVEDNGDTEEDEDDDVDDDDADEDDEDEDDEDEDVDADDEDDDDDDEGEDDDDDDEDDDDDDDDEDDIDAEDEDDDEDDIDAEDEDDDDDDIDAEDEDDDIDAEDEDDDDDIEDEDDDEDDATKENEIVVDVPDKAVQEDDALDSEYEVVEPHDPNVKIIETAEPIPKSSFLETKRLVKNKMLSSTTEKDNTSFF
jgi:hypothetical protein